MKDSTIERVWSIILGLGLGTLFIILNIFLNMSFTTAQAIDGSKGRMLANLFCCLLAVVSVWILLFALKKISGITFKLDSFSKKSLVTIFFGLVIYRLLTILCFHFMMQKGMSTTINDQMLNQSFKGVPLFVVVFIYGFCTPIMEEMVFRGGIIGLVFKKNQMLGILFSSILFSALHNPSEVFSWIIYGGFALIVGYAYSKTKELGVPVAIHILNNVIGIVGLLLH